MKADYVIVGAGSAGCVIANRLSADPKVSVVLLEAGPADLNPWIHIPVGYFKTIHNPTVDWCYKTEPDQGLNGRSIDWPRGRVLGGSSSLNGLLYVRGQPQDYDRWAQMGNKGWGWEDVLPLFKRSEKNERGADEFHGDQGNLSVSNMRIQRPITDAWVEAAQSAGYKFNPDYNGADQEGVGFFQLTAKNGRRCSSAVAFLNPVKSRKNLTIITHAQVEKLDIKDKRAVAVRYKDRSGTEHIVEAGREIILSGGSINSPQLLMLSGIGEAAQLAEHGIEVVADLQGVGKNLQDHLQARLVYKSNEPTLNDEVGSWLGQARIGLKYLMFRSGPMTMAASLATGFMKHGQRWRPPTSSSMCSRFRRKIRDAAQISFRPSPPRSVNCALNRAAKFVSRVRTVAPIRKSYPIISRPRPIVGRLWLASISPGPLRGTRR